MRLKVFTAPTMTQAMEQVRAALGDEAIIVATGHRTDGAVEITAARDADSGPGGGGGWLPFDPDEAGADTTGLTVEDIRLGLASHGTPTALIDRLAGRVACGETATATLAAAIDRVFGFLSLAEPVNRPLMFVGPPGAGKTTVVAKLAARLRRQGRQVRVITVDTRRAGAIEQLGAYTRILGIGLVVSRTPDALKAGLAAAPATTGAPVLIDAPGGNPFAEADRRWLADLAAAADAEPVLVLPAGGDPVEAIDLGAAFAGLGIRRLVSTRLDLARRLGGLFAAASAARTAFAEASVSHRIADDLVPLHARALAGLVLPEQPVPDRSAAAGAVHCHEV